MSHLEIILPFCIPPAALAPDLLRQLHTPAFASLIALANRSAIARSEDFSRLLPHESWLAGHFKPKSGAGIALADSNPKETRRSSPAYTHQKMQELGLTPPAGFWFSFSPVHIHIARDHLVLTDQRRLPLSEAESRSLFEAALSMCEEFGRQLRYGDAKTWFLRADDWQDFCTATMDAACGHNIDIWTPQGAQELVWRKLQNEIQMLWHIHPVNAAREMRGENSVNSAWLHGGSGALLAAPTLCDASLPLAQIIAAGKSQKHISLLLDALLEPALNSDWGAWLDAMHTLETETFAPLLKALSQGDCADELSLIVTDAGQLARFSLNQRSLWKFWRKPSLQPLFSISTP